MCTPVRLCISQASISTNAGSNGPKGSLHTTMRPSYLVDANDYYCSGDKSWYSGAGVKGCTGSKECSSESSVAGNFCAQQFPSPPPSPPAYPAYLAHDRTCSSTANLVKGTVVRTSFKSLNACLAACANAASCTLVVVNKPKGSNGQYKFSWCSLHTACSDVTVDPNYETWMMVPPPPPPTYMYYLPSTVTGTKLDQTIETWLDTCGSTFFSTT